LQEGYLSSSFFAADFTDYTDFFVVIFVYGLSVSPANTLAGLSFLFFIAGSSTANLFGHVIPRPPVTPSANPSLPRAPTHRHLERSREVY